MENLLVKFGVYLLIGFLEWWLALRRTLACARLEIFTLVTIVFIENIVSFWVLSKFILSNDWGIAISYAVGGSLGSLVVTCMNKDKVLGKTPVEE